MHFVYERSARSIGYRNIAIGLVLVLAGVVATLFGHRFTIVALGLIWFVAVVVGGVFLSIGTRLIRSNAVYRVGIDDTHFRLDMPPEEQEHPSFNLALDEIKSTLCKQVLHGKKRTWTFSILLKDGRRVEFPKHIGLNPKKLFKKLEQYRQIPCDYSFENRTGGL